MIKSGYEVYLRTYFDENRDLVQRLHVFDQAVIGDNNPFNFYVTYLIPNSNSSTASGILYDNVPVHGCYDDACPMNYNGTYIGGNHGLSDLRIVNSNSHNKTVGDVGSEWVDKDSRKWYLLRVVNEISLWFLSENTGTEDIWDFDTTINGNLIHSANAVNVDSIIVESYTQGQLEPAIKNHQKKLFLDNGFEVLEDGVYYSKAATVNEYYDIVNPVSALEYVKSQTGSSIQPSLNAGDSTVSLSIDHIFDRFGGCSMKYFVEINKMIDVSIIGGIQSGVLNKGNYSAIYAYAPGSLPISDGTNSWDFRTLRDFSSSPLTSLHFTSDYWEDSNKPPYRFIEFLGTDLSNLDVSFMQSYNITRGSVLHSSRLTSTDNAGFVAATRKVYPFVVNGISGNIPAGTKFDIYAYRGYIDPNRFSNNASVVYVFEDGSDVILTCDYHKICNDTITISEEFNNRIIEIVDQNQNIEIITEYIDSSRIIVNSNSDYAYAYLKLREFLAPESVSIVYSAQQADVSWVSAYGADSYKIYRSTDPYSGFSLIGTSTTTSYTDSDISGSNKYFYKVTAVNQ